MTQIQSDLPVLPRFLNVLALVGTCGILTFAFIWQFAFNELPCPLCQLQRVAFVLVGIGLLLNVRFGSSPMHYGIVIISALGGALVSARQMALHIMPGDPGYGGPFLGLHFYTWALLMFMAFIAYCGILLMIDRSTPAPRYPPAPGLIARLAMWLFLILIAANLVSTLLECGFGACPENPVSYLWLPS